MMKKMGVLYLLLVSFFLVEPAHAATVSIDLVHPFETAENDGVIHFGDQNILSFVDNSADYPNATSVKGYFNLNGAPLDNGTFKITLNHYQASFDAGYSNYFSINTINFDVLEDSEDIPGHDILGQEKWHTQIFTGNTDFLHESRNEIIFHIDSKGNNQDDFEITDFSLTYETASVPVPGAAWLLGWGLLGLVGINRHKK